MSAYLIKNTSYQKGIGLLEVLIAVLVLAVGIMALSKFQGGLLRSGSDAKARTIATNLAQERMETLRTFENRTAFDAIVNDSYPASCPSSQPNCKKNPIEYPGTGSSFVVSWNVTDYAFSAAGSAPVTPPPAGARTDMKRITVRVDWTDPSGPQQVELESYVNSSIPAESGQAIATGASSTGPVVGYNPGAAPEIVAIPVSPSQNMEATSPIPDVEVRSGTRIVSFDEITYNRAGVVRQRDSYKTINCVCALNGDGNGLKPTYYDPQKGWVVGEQVSKTVGTRATGRGDIDLNRNGTIETNERNLDFGSQPEVCEICCRDHHDTTSTNPYDYYDPFRHTGTGNHQHFYALLNESTGVTNYIPAISSGNIYLEACRYIRVDGILRLAQDWRMENMQVVPASFLSSSDGVTAYTNFVKKFIREYISSISTGSYPAATPDPGFTGWTEWALLPNSEDSDTNTTLTPNDQTLAVRDTRQLVGRAIYIDHMSPALVNELKTSLSSSPDDFSKVPFHEVNITRLANWPTPGSAIRVSDEPIPARGCTTFDCYSRGLVTAVSATTGTLAQAIMTRSNSGVAASHPIDNANDPDTAEKNDALKFVVTGAATTIGITININVTAASSAVPTARTAASDIRVLDSNQYCFAVNRSNGVFKCELPTGVNSFSMTVSGYTKPDTIRCSSGSGNNAVRWNQPIIYDNRAVLQSTSTFSPTRTVTGDRTADDTTTFDFSALPTNVTTQTINLLIEADGGQIPSSCPSSPPTQ